MLFMLLLAAPPAAADGMPMYAEAEFEGGDPEEAFKSIFESRQLAEVELLNDSHERINLFLSVYSLDPGTNLSVAVPLRTVPAYISGTPVGERDFRERFFIEEAEDEVVRQDTGDAWGRVADGARDAVTFAFGSLVCSMPGEYLRENVHADVEGTPSLWWGGGMLSGGDEGYDPDLLQHYEFDGFTVDVRRVGAGPTLDEYLAGGGMRTTSAMPVGAYGDQYLAVIESRTRPPIEEDEFEAVRAYDPDIVSYIQERASKNPDLDEDGIEALKEHIFEDGDMGVYRANHTVQRAVAKLVEAVYGRVDFAGEALAIDLPLDGGKVFFPLGTSVGWPNEVGDIDVLFRVPEDRDLEVRGARDAFFNGSHWYLFEMEGANPDYDLDSPVTTASEGNRKDRQFAAALTDNAGALGALVAVGVLMALWAVAVVVAGRARGAKGPGLRRPHVWLLLVAAVLLSLPGAVLAYLVWRPMALDALRRHRPSVAAVAMFPMAVAAFAVGVAL